MGMRGGHVGIVATVVDEEECFVVCVFVDALSFFAHSYLILCRDTLPLTKRSTV